ncbi:von Willebrand factor A domain-containing protein 7-like [Anneissia japonica]|uniref:von Willebrand factor A domain-containing protein 7-like n=1 Tax=Anneissia japonica TaxID=1529436 RepID=UPI001425964F|nr:von Willebrand factor A domain-containing protein 7-like [Anneissia japonica]
MFYVAALLWFNVFYSDAFIPNEWLQFSSKYTSTHVEITERAILDVATDYFLNHPRVKQPIKPLTVSAPYTSATDLFKAYYGNKASPRKFEEAIKELLTANANVDLDLTVSHLASAHFDAEQFISGNQRLLTLRQAIVSSINDGHFEAARSQCGQLLHTLQDFYSHSNWIEIGHTDLNFDLGVSGGNLGKIADPTLPTCIDCGNKGSSNPTCKNNVLNYIKRNKILTSGYSDGQVNSDGKPINKPRGIGKCTHGGGSSNSANEAGGINKDTSNQHLSPHFYYHKQAAQLAMKATVNFLQKLRESVGESSFARFLNLGLGSTLCIVMDTSGSMRNDMDAAINRSYHIIDSRMGTDTDPANFVLVPFHDPVFGPATVTDDAEKFKAALNNLKTKDGGDCPELVLNGLRLALTHSEPYSSCFVFTDASAKDDVMRDSVVALAQHKKIEVSFFVSGNCWHSVRGRRSTNRSKRALIGNKLYSDIAFSTGGQALDLTKKDVLEGTQIIESTVQLSKVSLFKAYDIPATPHNGREHIFPIDLTLMEVTVEINGFITKMQMVDPKGKIRPIKNAGDIKFTAKLPSLRVVKMVNLEPGMWKIRVDSFMSYSVSVYGLSTLDFIHTFGKSETNGPHPGHKEISGRPLKGKPAHIMMKIFGAIGQDIARMEQMDLVDITDKILTSTTLQKISPISQYTAEAVPPDIPFLVRLVGRDGNGNVIHRLLNSVVEPSTTEIIAYASTKNSILAPGGTSHVKFTVFNIGKPALFRIKATDEKGFVQMVTPDRVNLHVNESADGYIKLLAPENAAFGTTSTVTLTVQTNTAGQTFNFMVFDIIVAPQDLDEEAPVCNVIERQGDCSMVRPDMDCSRFNYSVTASFMDVGYGLYNIQAKYPTQIKVGRQIVEAFQVGLTNVSVKGVFHSTCCQPKVQLMAIDVVGNVGRCFIEMTNLTTSPVNEDKSLSIFILIACIGLGIVGLLILIVICIICRKRIRNKVIFIK